MDLKKEPESEFKAAIRGLKLKKGDVLAWKEYSDRVVLVTSHGQKLTWWRDYSDAA